MQPTNQPLDPTDGPPDEREAYEQLVEFIQQVAAHGGGEPKLLNRMAVHVETLWRAALRVVPPEAGPRADEPVICPSCSSTRTRETRMSACVDCDATFFTRAQSKADTEGHAAAFVPRQAEELDEFAETKAGVRAHIAKFWKDDGPDQKINLSLPRCLWDELLAPKRRAAALRASGAGTRQEEADTLHWLRGELCDLLDITVGDDQYPWNAILEKLRTQLAGTRQEEPTDNWPDKARALCGACGKELPVERGSPTTCGYASVFPVRCPSCGRNPFALAGGQTP